MKIIENKSTSIMKSADVLAKYADLLVIVLNKPLQKTVTLKEMRRDINLIGKLEDAEDIIELTDEEYQHLNKLVQESEWAIKHNDIIEFADYIESLDVV